jgi:hypothetical protein
VGRRQRAVSPRGLAVAASLAGAVLLAGCRGERAHPCEVVLGPVALPDVPEASGLVASRRTPGLLWSHNDSGNRPVLVAIDASGAVRGRVPVPIRTRDWEDISAGPCPAGQCLYLFDIGDNDLSRRRVSVFRVPEPAPADEQAAAADVFSLAYPDGPHNAEAAFVTGADLFIVTRDRTGIVYRTTLPAGGGNELPLERVGALGLPVVTDAEPSPDGRLVVVRTSNEVVVYRQEAFAAGGAVTAAWRLAIGALREPQGEGVALDARGVLYLASEGRWSRSGSLIGLRCTLPG